jgi:acylphosphatase
MQARAHVWVRGRVQGVCFRAETANVARSLRLDGWVRNLSDGSVEALFEGQKESVEKAIDFCKRGPPSAYVSSLEVKWEEWKGEFQAFNIIRWRL